MAGGKEAHQQVENGRSDYMLLGRLQLVSCYAALLVVAAGTSCVSDLSAERVCNSARHDILRRGAEPVPRIVIS